MGRIKARKPRAKSVWTDPGLDGTPLQVVLPALTTVLRPGMLAAGYGLESCVAAARMAIDVLTACGIPAAPVPVMTAAWNEHAVHVLNEHGGDMPAALAHLASPSVQQRHDLQAPWMVGVGSMVAPPRGITMGHVAVSLPRHGILLDLAIDQAARPERALRLAPLWIHDHGWSTRPGTGIILPVKIAEGRPAQPDQVPDALLQYQHGVSHYQQHPDWHRTRPDARETSPAGALVERTLTAIRRAQAA